jgi:hypothetical protein
VSEGFSDILLGEAKVGGNGDLFHVTSDFVGTKVVQKEDA